MRKLSESFWTPGSVDNQNLVLAAISTITWIKHGLGASVDEISAESDIPKNKTIKITKLLLKKKLVKFNNRMKTFELTKRGKQMSEEYQGNQELLNEELLESQLYQYLILFVLESERATSSNRGMTEEDIVREVHKVNRKQNLGLTLKTRGMKKTDIHSYYGRVLWNMADRGWVGSVMGYLYDEFWITKKGQKALDQFTEDLYPE